MTIALEHACDFTVELSPPHELGSCATGVRRIIPIVGGTVTGRIAGRVLNLGADWQTVYPGHAELDTRYAIETHDGRVWDYATLAAECAALGADWVGPRLRAAAHEHLDDDPGDRLWAFYTAYRATFRARQALAHLLDPAPRTPGKWRPQAERYLAEAERVAPILETPEVP